jgi:basic amino acid/polyamine antiporter, APA family
MSLRHSPLFARKPIETLLKEMEGGERLHRVLGPVALTSLGVGATIGTGIYILTGEVAHNLAGPSLMLSFLIAAVGCGFAALCYSELASMVPVAGSAYTYAYATLGELIAWIIGWDLVLEYAIGSSAVANGWSSYFKALTKDLLKIELDPRFLKTPYDFANGHWFANMVTLSSGETCQAWFNLPAVFITVVITAILGHLTSETHSE